MTQTRRQNPPSPSSEQHQTAGPSPADPRVADLETILRGLVAEHERLLDLAAVHRAALARADTGAIGACVGNQNEVLQRVAELEKRRERVVALLTDTPRAGDVEAQTPHSALRRSAGSRLTAARRPAGAEAARTTITSLAQTFPEPARERIAGLAANLREVINRVQRENRAVLAAAETLSSHMEGLMRQIGRRLSHAGTYGRRGSVDASAQVVSALDLRM